MTEQNGLGSAVDGEVGQLRPAGAVWPLEPHTRAKHELLRSYLGGWFPVMASGNNSRVVFFDGFAGPGVYAGGEPGSPVIALHTFLEHTHRDRLAGCEFVFVFNERDPARYRSLQEQLERVRLAVGGWPPEVRVVTSADSFPDVAEQILDSLEGASLAPTFAFLDPFGYGDLPLDLLRRFLAYDKCELFIYFDFNSASRFATSGVVDPAFTALYGTDEFKQAPLAGDPGRGPFLRDLYERQLSTVVGFPHVQWFEMITGQGHVGHYLFFCTRHVSGLRIMKHAMWKVAGSGDFRFVDRLAGQEVLFGSEVDTGPLREAFLEHFAGQSVPIEALEEYALTDAPYTDSHVKKLTLKPMQAESLITVTGQRRKGTFPSGTVITFPSRG